MPKVISLGMELPKTVTLVGSKFHLVKDHFISQLDLYGAIGSFNEDIGESDHVDGNREN